MKRLFTLLLITVLFSVISCSKDDDSEEDGMSTSSNGVTINLTWTPSTVDLDMTLVFQERRISISETETPGETLQIADGDGNGVYEANIFYFTGTETVTYTLTVLSSEGTELFSTTQSSPPSDGSLNIPIDTITIEKNDNNFIISE